MVNITAVVDAYVIDVDVNVDDNNNVDVDDNDASGGSR